MTSTDRARAHEQRLLATGHKSLRVWLPPDAATALARIRTERGCTVTAAVVEAILSYPAPVKVIEK